MILRQKRKEAASRIHNHPVKEEIFSIENNVLKLEDKSFWFCICTVCHQCFDTKELLERHKMEIHNHASGNEEIMCKNSDPPKKQCHICKKIYFSQRTLTKHLQTHNQDSMNRKSYFCQVCDKNFTRKLALISHLNMHMRDAPSKYNSQQNQNQNNHSTNRRQLTYLDSGSVEYEPFYCNYCGRAFSTKQNLVTHMRIHTGEKPYMCELCHKCFRHKAPLVTHNRTHTGDKPFNCTYCQRAFSTKQNLATHTRIHTGEKPYSCKLCDKCFRNKAQLTNHTRTHTGEKPFICSYCQRCFSTKQNLVTHTRVHLSEKGAKVESDNSVIQTGQLTNDNINVKVV